MDSKDSKQVDSAFDSDVLFEKLDKLVDRLTGDHNWRIDDRKLNREVSEIILESIEEAFDGK